MHQCWKVPRRQGGCITACTAKILKAKFRAHILYFGREKAIFTLLATAILLMSRYEFESEWERQRVCLLARTDYLIILKQSWYKRHANKLQSWSIPFECVSTSHSNRYDRPRNLRVHLCSWPFPLSFSLFFYPLSRPSFIDWVKCAIASLLKINYTNDLHFLFLFFFLLWEVSFQFCLKKFVREKWNA